MTTAPTSPGAIKLDSDITARSKFRHDAVKAWEAFLATGLHASSVEVDTWLDQLEAGKDVEPPERHA